MIAVAMSGGVDSSVAAALLLEAGHDVLGVTLALHGGAPAGSGASCGGGDAIGKAREAAAQLGVPHRAVDAARAFEEGVLRPAWEEYARGRTPNPCLLCNERVKFGALLDAARALGADGIATGHYARIERDGGGPPRLRRGADPGKDQSYFLAGLSRAQLGAALFPLGGLRKAGVREMARARGLAAGDAAESQDACLVGPEGGFAEALRERFGGEARPGRIVDGGGRELGRHDGIHLFTVGQRKGLGVASTGRLFVREIRERDGAIVVTADEGALIAGRLTVRDVAWAAGRPPEAPLRCEVQVRYRSAPCPAVVTPLGGGAAAIAFEAGVRAVTPGQAAVLYDGEYVLGRGWIE